RGRRGGRGLVAVRRVSVCVGANAQQLRSRGSPALFRPLVSIFSFALRNSASRKLEQNRGLNSQTRRISRQKRDCQPCSKFSPPFLQSRSGFLAPEAERLFRSDFTENQLWVSGVGVDSPPLPPLPSSLTLSLSLYIYLSISFFPSLSFLLYLFISSQWLGGLEEEKRERKRKERRRRRRRRW
ncbi:hypothetical protein AOLI_G00212460, partial [Acnodon oligacanthus]